MKKESKAWKIDLKGSSDKLQFVQTRLPRLLKLPSKTPMQNSLLKLLCKTPLAKLPFKTPKQNSLSKTPVAKLPFKTPKQNSLSKTLYQNSLAGLPCKTPMQDFTFPL